MSPQRRVAELEPAYLLHSRAYRDTSAILEVFARDHGRVGVVAKGVRSQKSRLRGVLQPFVPLLLSWSGRGDLGTLTGAELNGRAAGLTGARLAAGFYLNELLLRLLRREDPHAALFQAYRAVLGALVESDDPEPPLRLFEKRLLEEIGYAPTLDHDDELRPVEPAGWYQVQAEGLPVRLTAYQEGAHVVRGASLLALANEQALDAAAAADAKRIMRLALRPHLGSRPLNSRELYRQLAAIRTRRGSKE